MAVYNLLPLLLDAQFLVQDGGGGGQLSGDSFPKLLSVGAYSKIWFQEKFVNYFLNSLIVSVSTATFSSLVGAFAAYGFPDSDLKEGPR